MGLKCSSSQSLYAITHKNALINFQSYFTRTAINRQSNGGNALYFYFMYINFKPVMQPTNFCLRAKQSMRLNFWLDCGTEWQLHWNNLLVVSDFRAYQNNIRTCRTGMPGTAEKSGSRTAEGIILNLFCFCSKFCLPKY